MNANGTASFALPRAEVGQGITTAVAMLIADELDLPLDQVEMSLADARPELLFNQLTGGSTRSARSTRRCVPPPRSPGNASSRPPRRSGTSTRRA